MRKKIVIAVTFLVGLYYLLEFVLPPHLGGGFDCRSMNSPCLVETDDGCRLYYTGLRGLKGSSDVRFAIGLAESTDGTTWRKADGNPLLGRSLFRSKDWGGPDRPAVVREPDGTYTLFYVGHGADGTDRLMRSTSADGRRWRSPRVVLSLLDESAGAARSVERVTISALAVLRTEEGYVAYLGSTYRSGGRTIEGVSRATSTDGLAWTLDEANNPVLPIEPENGWQYKAITGLSIVETDEGLRLYYAGTRTYVLEEGKGEIPVTLVGLATSDEGIHWVRHAANPIFGPAMFDQGLEAYMSWILAPEKDAGADGRKAPTRFDAAAISGVSVVRTADGYMLAYAGSSARDGRQFQVGTAASPDGVKWHRGEAPALELGREPVSTYLSSGFVIASQVFTVIGAMAVGLGLFGLASLHGGRIIKGNKEMAYSIGFFLALIFTLIVAFGWGEEEPKVVTNGHRLYNVIFLGMMASFDASTMGLLTFYLASAAYRSFRLKNAEAALMMLAAILVLLGQVPLGQLVTAWMPDTLRFLRVENVAYWINSTIQVSTMRAIQIGASVGGLVLATRLWLSMENRRD